MSTESKWGNSVKIQEVGEKKWAIFFFLSLNFFDLIKFWFFEYTSPPILLPRVLVMFCITSVMQRTQKRGQRACLPISRWCTVVICWIFPFLCFGF